MDSGGNMQSNEERIAEKLMDNYLKSQGFHRKKIAKDGSCLFRAVAEQVLHCQSLHTEVRAKCVEFLKKNRDSYEAFIEGDFEEYLCKLQDPQQWVGEVEINALAVMYKRDFLIYQEPGKPAVNITDNNFKDKVRLCFLNGNHYDSVYPLESIKSAAICQSILYELLYEGVFKVDRNSLGSCQRTSRASDLLSDDCMNVCMSSDESDLETDEPLWVENGTASSSSRPSNHSYRGRGRGRLLPERVRRSLNPTLLRNVDYDIWHKTKRAQQKIDYSIAAGMQFSAGDRCQVRQEKGHSYKATIKDVPADNGLVTVYIEELGEKKVPLWYLRPINEENSWTTVTNRDKRLSNGHGEWESRGRGRGRGKTIGASSSSVSPATGVGSTGRMQKQHSWPPQATAEEQGGGKSNRKSLSSTDSCFGLTEEERLAKKKEKEKNAALVEIQLKDEESFPALGSQSEFGRKKLGDKRRTQRNKMRSPVDEVRAPSPTAGDRPKSSTPPPAAPPVNVTSHTNSALPAAKPAANFDPTGPSSLNVNMAAATISAPASVLPPNIVTTESKPSTQSYASAAAVPVSPPPGIKPPAPSSASLFSFITPVLPAASAPAPPSSSSSAASPPPQALAAAPTFIAPIAPSPTGAQGFKRPFSPLTSLPRPPSPPSSSSTIIPPPVQVKEALPAPTHALPKIEGSLSAYQTSQSETSASQNLPQVVPNQVKASVSPPEITTQHSLQEIQTDSFPPNQIQAPQHQLQAHAEEDPEPQTLLPPQSESTPVQSPHPPPELPQVLQSPSIQSSEEPLPPKSDSPPSDPQHSHPPPPVSAPQIHPHLPHPQSIPGTVPLQQLTQLYQDPLYPGFPQGEKGEAVQGVSFSTTKSGDDLPKDINVLRFFFNLGVKAYSTAMYPPCVYLFPLQQYYTMQLKPPSHAPSPTYASPSPPAKPQEAYQPSPPYPPASASPQFNHQTPPAEPPRHTEPSFNPNLYQGVTQPPPQRMPCTSYPWQQVPPPRNPSCPVAYPSPPPPYSNPSPSSQGYHPGQAPVHSLYPSAAPPYPHFPIRYQPSSAPEELQVSQGAMEQLPPGNADPIHSHGHVRVLGPMETPPAANMVNPNNNRGNMLPANYSFNRTFSPSALKKEPGEVLTRTVLLVDPPLNNKPILAVVSDPDMSDASLRSSSNPGSPSGYRGPRKHFPSTKPYPAPSAPDHSHMVYTAAGLGMAEPLSVACSTEDDFDVDLFGYQGQRRVYRGRGGRGRSSYDPGRGMQRRRHGDQGAVTQYYSSSFRGRGRAY